MDDAKILSNDNSLVAVKETSINDVRQLFNDITGPEECVIAED